MDHKILVHKPEDSVGVAIAGINAGEKVVGIITDNGYKLEVESISEIPFGHKIALKPIAQGERVVIYGWSCGYASQPITCGEHVHTHNFKSARW
ncbi:MAG: UxaA family hydrolase [Candidatus Desulforudis sp.]|nr:UxaA family hydrolase [Desulforudis sp.]